MGLLETFLNSSQVLKIGRLIWQQEPPLRQATSLTVFLVCLIVVHMSPSMFSPLQYGCTRGVAGAPFFFVNGFLLPDAGSALDLETWKSIISPLVKNQREQVQEALSSY